jgi:hypothetical protein
MKRVILPAGKARASVRDRLAAMLDDLDGQTGYIVTITEQGEERTNPQNKLQQLWHAQAADQLRDESAEEKRAYCKLHFGVPILRADDAFKADYDRIIKPMDYQTKLALMAEPFDFPVTRLMTVKQKKEFLDAIWNHYTGLGVRLSHPDDMGRAA